MEYWYSITANGSLQTQFKVGEDELDDMSLRKALAAWIQKGNVKLTPYNYEAHEGTDAVFTITLTVGVTLGKVVVLSTTSVSCENSHSYMYDLGLKKY